jgi:hypothetical protein
MQSHQDVPIYSVGQMFDPRKRKWEEGTMYTYHQDLHQVLIFFSHIQPFEQQAVERGVTHFALFVEGDVIMLLFKMDGPKGRGVDWHDAPYSWHLVPEEARTLPTPPEDIPQGDGAAVSIFLIDAATGVIRALRVMALGHEFTRQLFRAIREQAARPFDHLSYMRQVVLLRERFPLAQTMAEAAPVTCQVGARAEPAGE